LDIANRKNLHADKDKSFLHIVIFNFQLMLPVQYLSSNPMNGEMYSAEYNLSSASKKKEAWLYSREIVVSFHNF
jgi:hypothetical protein